MQLARFYCRAEYLRILIITINNQKKEKKNLLITYMVHDLNYLHDPFQIMGQFFVYNEVDGLDPITINFLFFISIKNE